MAEKCTGIPGIPTDYREIHTNTSSEYLYREAVKLSVELKDDKKLPGVAGIPIKPSVYKTQLKGFTKFYNSHTQKNSISLR